MRILALDSSQLQAAVCLLEDRKIIGTGVGAVNVAHSEALLPVIDKVLKSTGTSASEIDAFAVGVGPGSFTGIRIGCATMKAFAQAMGKPVLGFSSLRALACSAGSGGGAISMVNAYQGQVFAGWLEGADWKEDAIEAARWVDLHVRPHERNIFCGAGAKQYWTAIVEASERRGVSKDNLELKAQIEFVTPDGVAGEILRIMERPDMAKGALKRYTDLHANYLRPSQAEIKFGAI